METKKTGTPNPDVLLKEAKDKKKNALIFYGIGLLLIVGYILVEDYNVSGWAYGGAVVLLLLEVGILATKPSDEVKKQMTKYEAELEEQKKETEHEARLNEARKAAALREKKDAQEFSIQVNENLNKLKTSLQQTVDKDANGQIDLIESSVFIEAVKTHQKEIQAINPDFVKNFVKLENHLASRRSAIKRIFKHLMKFKFRTSFTGMRTIAKETVENWELQKNFLMGEMKAYTAVQYNAIHMVNALLTDDMITFYEIYEAFDKLEIWHSQYEKVSTAQLQSLNDNIRSLIRTTEESTNRIVDGLGDLTYRMAKQNDNLKEIHGAVTAGNLLSAINTFQLHRISKNTKSLRE